MHFCERKLVRVANDLLVSSFHFYAVTGIVTNSTTNHKQKQLQRKMKHTRAQTVKLSLLFLTDLVSDLVSGCRSVRAKMTQHTREVRNPLREHFHQHLEKKSRDNPVRPPAGLIFGTRGHAGQSLRIIWQRKGLGLRTRSHTL